MVAVSVDLPERSEALRRELRLPFPLLCDTTRQVVQRWNPYDPREKGGIAKPAVFVIERDRTVRYGAVDAVATRVPAKEIVRLLQTTATQAQSARRKTYLPRLGEWMRAIRHNLWG